MKINNDTEINNSSFSEVLSSCMNKNKYLLGVKTAIITISDRASKGIYEDKSGIIIKENVEESGAFVQDYCIVSDDENEITNKIKNVIDNFSPLLLITTGGTGLSKRDNTQKVVESLSDRIIPGIGEALRLHGSKFTKNSWVSCAMGAIIKRTLIISLPGAPDAVKQSMVILKEFLPHALYKLQN